MKTSMKRLPVLPSMRCDTGCGECCGVVPATDDELRRIKSYIKMKGIVPMDQGVTCPFFQKGTCQVYPVRPIACQLFGHVEKMTCPRGYNVNVSEKTVAKLFRRQGKKKADHFLHEFLPSFTTDGLIKTIEDYAQVDFSSLPPETGV
jgi:hypothetical protein